MDLFTNGNVFVKPKDPRELAHLSLARKRTFKSGFAGKGSHTERKGRGVAVEKRTVFLDFWPHFITFAPKIYPNKSIWTLSV